MEIKKEFTLLKGTNNYIEVSSGKIEDLVKEENRPRRLRAFLKLNESKIRHPSRDIILDFISSEEGNNVHVVEFNQYILPVTYNKSDDSIIINLKPFHVDEISKLGVNTVYASILYGILFRKLLNSPRLLKDSYFSIITNYYTSVFVRLFGKQFGLLGRYSNEILKLKFLISSYVLASFFGIEGQTNWKKSATVSGVDYREIKEEVERYDFTDISDFIKALSDLGVMPGLNKYRFTEKFLKLFTVNFLPALEDASRFISSIGASSVSGNQVIPHFISKYNEQEYSKLMELSNSILKRK